MGPLLRETCLPNLANNNPIFNVEYNKTRELQFLLTSNQESLSNQYLHPVEENQIQEHIQFLKNRKAAGRHGLTAHHSCASPKIAAVTTALTNKVLLSKQLPIQCRIGKVVPTLNWGHQHDLNSHRRITINSKWVADKACNTKGKSQSGTRVS